MMKTSDASFTSLKLNKGAFTRTKIYKIDSADPGNEKFVTDIGNELMVMDSYFTKNLKFPINSVLESINPDDVPRPFQWETHKLNYQLEVKLSTFYFPGTLADDEELPSHPI